MASPYPWNVPLKGTGCAAAGTASAVVRIIAAIVRQMLDLAVLHVRPLTGMSRRHTLTIWPGNRELTAYRARNPWVMPPAEYVPTM